MRNGDQVHTSVPRKINQPANFPSIKSTTPRSLSPIFKQDNTKPKTFLKGTFWNSPYLKNKVAPLEAENPEAEPPKETSLLENANSQNAEASDLDLPRGHRLALFRKNRKKKAENEVQNTTGGTNRSNNPFSSMNRKKAQQTSVCDAYSLERDKLLLMKAKILKTKPSSSVEPRGVRELDRWYKKDSYDGMMSQYNANRDKNKHTEIPALFDVRVLDLTEAIKHEEASKAATSTKYIKDKQVHEANFQINRELVNNNILDEMVLKDMFKKAHEYINDQRQTGLFVSNSTGIAKSLIPESVLDRMTPEELLVARWISDPKSSFIFELYKEKKEKFHSLMETTNTHRGMSMNLRLASVLFPKLASAAKTEQMIEGNGPRDTLTGVKQEPSKGYLPMGQTPSITPTRATNTYNSPSQADELRKRDHTLELLREMQTERLKYWEKEFLFQTLSGVLERLLQKQKEVQTRLDAQVRHENREKEQSELMFGKGPLSDNASGKNTAKEASKHSGPHAAVEKYLEELTDHVDRLKFETKSLEGEITSIRKDLITKLIKLVSNATKFL